MRRPKLHVYFLLDETGSMESSKQQTMSGFNEYVKSLRSDKNSKNGLFSLTKFNSENVTIVYLNEKLKNVENLTNDNYKPAYITPLYDVIGKTIHAVNVKSGDAVLFIIQTDGQENASQEYNQRMIFDLISEKKKEGWTFIFLGANQDAYAASAGLGIPQMNTLSYNSANSQSAFNLVATRTATYTSNLNNKGIIQTDSFFETGDSKV